MRTKEELKYLMTHWAGFTEQSANQRRSEILLEVLLDIRDLLTSKENKDENKHKN